MKANSIPTKTESVVAVQYSALWAAYADALGFVAEFVEADGLFRRSKTHRLTNAVGWKRHLGGRFGPLVDLPPGGYSDDTQLRLATSRSIRGDGSFDVEAFAKVELPVWLCYALGAGRSSKVAASSLAHPDVRWFSNFFEKQRGAEYVQGGGNGAAMRIQPHVWAADPSGSAQKYIPDIIRNAVCTHGHARAILGAVFHGVCVGESLRRNAIPGPEEWSAAIELFHFAAESIKNDPELSALWLPVWEERAGSTLKEAFFRVAGECMDDLQKAERYYGERPEVAYSKIAAEFGADKEDSRGSGVRTAMLAGIASWLFRNEAAKEAVLCVVNLLGTDTDTIGTMTGAIVGASGERPPDDFIQDREYIQTEATRLSSVPLGKSTSEFVYPDLLSWLAPRTQIDAVGMADQKLCVSGLSFCERLGPEYTAPRSKDAVWQWLKLDFGQTVLAKRRPNLETIPKGNWPENPGYVQRTRNNQRIRGINADVKPHPRQLPFGTEGTIPKTSSESRSTLDALTREAINSDFSPEIIGRHVLVLSEHPDGIEKAVAYVSIVAKARMARNQRSPQKS